jgi:hypothetical protein
MIRRSPVSKTDTEEHQKACDLFDKIFEAISMLDKVATQGIQMVCSSPLF